MNLCRIINLTFMIIILTEYSTALTQSTRMDRFRIKRSDRMDCKKIFDAAIWSRHKDDHILLFNDTDFWEYSYKSKAATNRKQIKDWWPHVSLPLDAGITLKQNQTYYNIFFKVSCKFSCN